MCHIKVISAMYNFFGFKIYTANYAVKCMSNQLKKMLSDV